MILTLAGSRAPAEGNQRGRCLRAGKICSPLSNPIREPVA
jgi:hypothetical protein